MNGRVRIEPRRPYLVIPDSHPPDTGERQPAEVQEAPADDQTDDTERSGS